MQLADASFLYFAKVQKLIWQLVKVCVMDISAPCNYCPHQLPLFSAHHFLAADPDHRLVLLYLANDILQNGRRKGADMFNELFRDPLLQVIPLVW